jgi:superfamily II DNA or RNA helicase
MIVMVKTGLNKIDEIHNDIAKYRVLLVDECDLSTSDTYKNFIKYTYRCYWKIGMSGSALVDKRKSKLQKNETIRAQFGEVLGEITNKEQIDKGYSAKVIVNIWKGNTEVKIKGDFPQEYLRGIIESPERNKKVIKRLKTHIRKQRLPILILVKNHAHIKKLFPKIEKVARKNGLKADWVHHKKKGRFDISKKFKDGNLDILLGSYILKRGKNFPLMRALINASGGDSMENTLQILGRATRAHESKTKTYLDDFHDEGVYLKRHANRRYRVYRDEKLRVIRRYKD